MVLYTIMKKIPCKSGDEVDAFSKRSRRLIIWKRGQLKKIKRKYWKRFRQKEKQYGKTE